MKNIAGFLILVSLVFALQSLYGEERSGKWAYAFSVSPTLGIYWGRAEEIVYKNSDTSDYLSQLLWDLKPLVYTGTDLEFGPRNLWTKSGFTAGLSLKYGFPFKTGIMEDRDWKGSDTLTHYSRHDAHSNGSFMFGLSLGFSWAFISRITLKVYGDFSYLRFSWTAEDGYYKYPPTDPEKSIYGPGITYTQNWLIFSPGVRFALRISRYFSLNGFTMATPFIYGFCRDEHYLKKIRFDDYLGWGLFIKGGIGFAFSPWKDLEFALSIGGSLIEGPRGDDYQMAVGETDGSYARYPDIGGAGFLALDVGFSVKITL
jgi:outer membrane protease